MPSSQEISALKKNDATRKNLLYQEHYSRRESLKAQKIGKSDSYLISSCVAGIR